MAEYLLKGGKMLAKTCPVCNCPLFEVKGETFCVVCREDEIEGQELVKKPVSAEKIEKKTSVAVEELVAPGGLEDEFALTIRALLIQAREERDSTRILHLMDAVKHGAEAYALLLYGYGRRDMS